MAKPLSGEKAIEALALKRARITDRDKVRYRVYRAPNDFVAVIAESALMAMKVAGVDNPFRIVRDLPNEQAALQAERVARLADDPPVMLPTERKKKEDELLRTELPESKKDSAADFVPMQAKDFEKKPRSWARVLTPDMVEQLRQQKPAGGEPQAAPAAAAPAQAPAAPVAEPIAEMPTPEAPAAPPLPQAPPPAAAAPAEPEAAAPGVLSETEVNQLLNG